MADKLTITEQRAIGPSEKTFIIAEIGQNHQGSLDMAKKLITVAKNCGVDCVKFQKTCIPEKFNKTALDRPYDNPNSWGHTYGEHKQYLEFSNQEFLDLQKFAEEAGILFTASAMDVPSLKFLIDLKVPFIKIGSGDANNLIIIERAAQSGIPLIISTGMLDFQEVKTIYNVVSKYHKKFALMHCLSSYPSPYSEINLNVINLYRKTFPDVNVGYSGHELGYFCTIGAVAMGAKIIERHITLDHNQKGSDHKCSLEPEELHSLVQQIRALEEAMGVPVKKLQPSEQACYRKLGKTIVFTRDLPAGRALEVTDLNIKVAEPKGIDGGKLLEMVGGVLRKNVKADDSLLTEHLQ